MSKWFPSLQEHISELRQVYIVEREEYTDYSREDHSLALAYRILASASIESHVEDLCKDAAQRSLARLKKQQPTRAGKALVTWYSVKKDAGTIPLDTQDYAEYLAEYDKIYTAYARFVDRSHGITDDALQKLVRPLGVKQMDISDTLLTLLGTLAENRNPAAHRRINRAKQMHEPVIECGPVESVLPLLQQLEDQLEDLVGTV